MGLHDAQLLFSALWSPVWDSKSLIQRSHCNDPFESAAVALRVAERA